MNYSINTNPRTEIDNEISRLWRELETLRKEIARRKANLIKACDDGQFDLVPDLTFQWQEARKVYSLAGKETVKKVAELRAKK